MEIQGFNISPSPRPPRLSEQARDGGQALSPPARGGESSYRTASLRKSQIVLIRVVWLCVINCFFLSVNLEVPAAQQNDPSVASETETRDEKVQSQPWEPSHPPADEFDWIQTTSGEWLKGELKVLYRDKLEFDSDKLGLQELDWEDVKYVRGHRIFSVRFEGPIIVEGLFEVTEDKVFVTVGEDRQEFERSQLIAVAPRGFKEIDRWSAKASFGLTLTRGNTDQTQWSASADIKRRTSTTRFIIDYLGIFTKTEGETTINNQRVNTNFDMFKTRRFFLRPIFGEYFRDPISNISHRGTVGTGVGYLVIDTSRTEWELSGGPGYQKTWFDSTEVGQNSSESSLAFVAGTHFNIELTGSVDFDFRYDFQIVNKTSGSYIHRMVPALETELTDWLDLDVSLVWDRIQDPQPDADGIVPEQDDYYFIVALGIEF